MAINPKIKSIIIIIISAAVLFSAFTVTGKTVMKTFYPIKYADYVEKYSEEYGVDPKLVYAVIKTESSFNPDAVSYAHAEGLTQITPETFDWLRQKLGEENENLTLFDPETSIKYGTFLLSYLIEKYENTDTAIAAYHAGIGRINGWLEDKEISPDGKKLNVIPIPETAHYVKKVNKALDIYNNLYK